MVKILFYIVIGIVIGMLLSDYKIVKKIDETQSTGTNAINRTVDVTLIPDSWKSKVKDYWEKQNTK